MEPLVKIWIAASVVGVACGLAACTQASGSVETPAAPVVPPADADDFGLRCEEVQLTTIDFAARGEEGRAADRPNDQGSSVSPSSEDDLYAALGEELTRMVPSYVEAVGGVEELATGEAVATVMRSDGHAAAYGEGHGPR